MKIKLTENQLKEYINKVVSEQTAPNIQPPQSGQTKQNGMGAILKPKNDKQSKEFLIRVLIDKLNNMKTDTRWQPTAVAQTIINNCNNFLQKKDIFQ